MITYGKHFIDKADKKAVLSTLASGWLTQGPKVIQFESEIKKKFGSKYCSVVSNGTAALHLIAIALGWGKNDTILCSPISFISGANSALYVGAIPDFVDIDKKTYNIDILKLEKKIISYLKKQKKIKAIVVTDFAGNPANWSSLRKISKKYKIKIINDNCHALGAGYKKDTKYAIKYADVVIHSYHPVKNITSGEGGAILTNDKKLYSKVNRLRSHGIKRSNVSWFYEMIEIGYNYRLTDIQSALGVSQLKKLDKFVKKRNQIAKIYSQNFNSNIFKKPEINENNLHSFHLYPLLIKFNKLKITKSLFLKKLLAVGIRLQVHYIPTYLHPFYKKKFKFKKNDFPISENFYKEEVSLPIYYSLRKYEAYKVINSIEKICKKNLK